MSLKILEVQLIRSQFSDSNEVVGKQATYAHGLYQTFVSGDQMLLALELLATVSRDPAGTTYGVPITTPFPSATGGRLQLQSMIAASRNAHQFIARSEMLPGLIRLQTLMSFITLYLTMEHLVIPDLRQTNPTWWDKRIAGQKYHYFYQLINEDHGNGSGSTGGDLTTGTRAPPRFKVDIAFGKNFWNLLQDLGVAALLMLAVSDTGLTVIGRAMGPDSFQRQSLRAALSRSRAWWSFAHAIGPATLTTFFGPRDVQYAVPQLLQKLMAEPLPTSSIDLLNRSCEGKGITINTEVHIPGPGPSDWFLPIGESAVQISHHPSSIPHQDLKMGNIWQWLEQDPNSQSIFEFLLPSGEADVEGAIAFFCNLYSHRALPCRMAIPFSKIPALPDRGSEGPTFEQILDTLIRVDKESHAPKLELLALPALVEQWTLVVILHFGSKCAKIYNWGKEGLGVKLKEVSAKIIYI